jgi:anti-sigma factor RsiW
MNVHPTAHPAAQILRSYSLGKLDDRSAKDVNMHLKHCPDCRQRVAELSAGSFLSRVRDASANDRSNSGKSQFHWSQSLERTGAAAQVPASTLPSGLADHPDYEIKRELGRGGMGVDYLAHNTLIGSV